MAHITQEDTVGLMMAQMDVIKAAALRKPLRGVETLTTGVGMTK